MFEILGPHNTFLKQWVDYIYHFSSDDPAFERQLIIFPNVGSAVTFYFDQEFREIGHQKFISIEKKGSHGVVLHLNRIDPIEIIDRGRQERITIVFKTLGINNFISTTLDTLAAGQNPTAIDIGCLEKRYGDLSQQLNSLTTIERVRMIEDFFVSIYEKKDCSLLEEILSHLNSLEKLTTIARKAGTTTKTMDRLFQKHIRLTPVEYRSILKFRNSLQSKISSGGRSLEDLAFESNYTDLPYMMKIYRKFTGQTAKTFFDRLSVAENGKYLYQET